MMAASMINTDLIRKHPAQAVLTVLGLSGVATVFLPFVWDYVPLGFFLEQLEELDPFGIALIVSPVVVLPFFISAGYLRWLFTGGLSRWESGIGYALALSVVALFSLSMIQDSSGSGFRMGFLIIASPALGLGAGIWFVIQNLRHGTPPTLTALVALQLAYLLFALGWLAVGPVIALIGGDASDIGIGAYLAFLAALVYTTQAALSVLAQRRVLLKLLPLALLWVSPVALFVWVWIEG